MSSTNNLVFEVQRCEPELVVPAKPTPQECKQLSDIDSQECLKFQVPIIQFYQYNPGMKGRDPVKVIKEAVAKTLVYYYPFAGRLREGPGRKLFVDCTAEGILFIEANADVTFEQLDDCGLQPPYPCMDELLYDVPNSTAILNSPLLLIQITRLKCGGIIFATRLNHMISDAFGFIQFMKAVAEIARGAPTLSVLPVWQRDLLNARDPPRVTCVHHEYDHVGDTNGTMIPLNNMAHCSFFFGPTEMSTIRKTLPTCLRRCSSFELLSAYIWRLRTMALQLNPEEEVYFLCVVNLRTKFNSLPLGYYGNAIAFPTALTTSGKLCQNPLGYAIELVKKAKANMTEEYMKSVADLMMINGQLNIIGSRSFMISDVTKVGFGEVDFGWEKATYGGPTLGGVGVIPSLLSYFLPFKNRKGEKGVVVSLCLPIPIMERFVVQLHARLNVKQLTTEVKSQKRINITSAL